MYAAFRTALFGAFFIVAAPFVASAADAYVDYVVENAASIPAPLVSLDDDAAGPSGPAVFGASGCADCHKTPGAPDAPAIGPDLTGVGARLEPGEIRLMIVNPRILLPETEMPAYYEIGRFGVAPEDQVGRTRLTPEEVERLVAYLSTLTATPGPQD